MSGGSWKLSEKQCHANRQNKQTNKQENEQSGPQPKKQNCRTNPELSDSALNNHSMSSSVEGKPHVRQNSRRFCVVFIATRCYYYLRSYNFQMFGQKLAVGAIVIVICYTQKEAD